MPPRSFKGSLLSSICAPVLKGKSNDNHFSNVCKSAKSLHAKTSIQSVHPKNRREMGPCVYKRPIDNIKAQTTTQSAYTRLGKNGIDVAPVTYKKGKKAAYDAESRFSTTNIRHSKNYMYNYPSSLPSSHSSSHMIVGWRKPNSE